MKRGDVMKRIWTHVVVVGSLTLVSASMAFAVTKTSKSSSASSAKATSSSKSKPAAHPKQPSLEQGFDRQMVEQFGPSNVPPKSYEDKTYKVKVETPGNWKFAGACSGSLWSILIAPGKGEVKITRRPDGS